MAVIEKIKNSAIVKLEDAYNYRWIDAWGQNVVKYVPQAGIPADASADPAGWTNTETGTNAIISHTTEGKFMKITTGGTEYNGVNLQLKGSAFKLETDKPCYFGVKCSTEHASKGDFLIGLCETDTSCLAVASAHAVTVTDDGVYFYHLNDETDTTFCNELGGTAGTTAIGGTHDTDSHIYEFFYDGSDLFAYYDDSLVVRITSGIANVALTPTINVRAGDDGAEVFDIDWIRVIQCR